MLKELLSIERELLAASDKIAESSRAASQMDVAGLKSQFVRAEGCVVETSPPQPASRPQAHLGTPGLAAVLAVLVAAALVGFILAPTRKSDDTIIAAEPTSAPAREQVALAPRPAIQKTERPPGPAQPAAAAVAALAREKTEGLRAAQPAAAAVAALASEKTEGPRAAQPAASGGCGGSRANTRREEALGPASTGCRGGIALRRFG